jgi:hypothetical protein
MNKLEDFIVSANKNYSPGKVDRMILASRPGIGKTSALIQLPNSIYFDLEHSAGHFKGEAEIVDIQEIAKANDWGPVTAIRQVCAAIKAAGKRYRFGVIDTMSVIDDIAEPLALLNYMSTPLGKGFDGKSIFELSHGAGYHWHRQAFQEITECFEGIAETLIFVSHIKDSSLKKGGENISVKDLRLTGMLKEIMSSKQDVCGILTLDKKEPTKRYIDFRKSEEDNFVKSRVAHLSGTKVLLSELKEDGTLVTYWENIFTSLKDVKK